MRLPDRIWWVNPPDAPLAHRIPAPNRPTRGSTHETPERRPGRAPDGDTGCGCRIAFGGSTHQMHRWPTGFRPRIGQLVGQPTKRRSEDQAAPRTATPNAAAGSHLVGQPTRCTVGPPDSGPESANSWVNPRNAGAKTRPRPGRRHRTRLPDRIWWVNPPD